LRSRIEFLEADAQSYAFPANAYDAAYSRFGVMFFADPVAAFRNLASGLARGGRLSFVCWRGLAENLWMAVPRSAGLQHLPPPQAGDPTAPGPFAFADARRVEAILAQAGFGDIRISPFDTEILLGRDLDEALGMALKVGPLGAMLREAPEQVGPVSGAVREVLRPYAGRQGVLLPAAAWIVQARRP
jgi:SAM-dependent methyltransferase